MKELMKFYRWVKVDQHLRVVGDLAQVLDSKIELLDHMYNME